MSEDVTRREKLAAVYSVGRFRPLFTLGVLCLSFVTAILEGVGLSFILPIVDHAQGNASGDPDGLIGVFASLYEFLGIPFTLESTVLGVALVIVVRYTTSFTVSWLRAILQTHYVRHLRTESFEATLDAEVEYFDKNGSDDILNAIITQTNYASNVIHQLVSAIKIGFVSLVYLSIATFLAPTLSLFAIVVLGIATLVSRTMFESGFSVGDRLAEANERVQEAVQAGTQGIRDAKLFGMEGEIFENYERSMDQWSSAIIKQRRNSAGINNFHQLIAALSVFIMIYLAIQFASLSVGALGVFLFAMFRLAPRVSTLNDILYKLEAKLPHLVRTQKFVTEIAGTEEESGSEPAPDDVENITFDDISFAYDEDEQILRDISFEVEMDETVAFVGESGAGKSTIVSLLARLYDPDTGTIRANGTPIQRFDIADWREQIAYVRQQPFIFNDTLRHNLTVGNRAASDEEIDRVVAIARVNEFLDELPEGYDTMLGDDGVRLSGGQKQRVALARALLKDADVLVLDEATSDLDRNIEAEVQAEIEAMERSYITITVAHRLSTVRNADRIYTIVDGEIADRGPHEELLEKEGKYAELYSA